MLRPKKLKSGAVLGVVSSSLPLSLATKNMRDKSYERLLELGFYITESPSYRLQQEGIEPAIEKYVEDIHLFFSHPDVDAIMDFGGSCWSHQVLERLDYDLIKNHPKPLLGCGGVTVLQLGVYSQTGLITYSSPGGATFSNLVLPSFSWRCFKQALMYQAPSFVLKESVGFSRNLLDEDTLVQKNHGWKVFREGKANGKIIAGSLRGVFDLLSTKFFPDITGAVLFVAVDEGESCEAIKRYFFRLKSFGVFKKISGLVVGRLPSSTLFSPSDSFPIFLDETLEESKFPVLFDFDYGPAEPTVTLSIGECCEIDTSCNQIKVFSVGS